MKVTNKCWKQKFRVSQLLNKYFKLRKCKLKGNKNEKTDKKDNTVKQDENFKYNYILLITNKMR